MNNYHSVGRCLVESLKGALTRAPVIVLTGARQTGKTTLVCDLLGQERRYLTLDDFETADRAEQNPDALLDTSLPLTIDEVQRAPQLLLAIKRRVDLKRIPGQFLLTGSANLALMRKVSESLSGRAIYKTLLPMTASEAVGQGGCGVWSELITNPESFRDRTVVQMDISRQILTGGYPPVVFSQGDVERSEWLEGYVRTYLERDLQMLSSIDQLADFRRLLRMVALRTGKLMNQSEMARDAGLTQPTAHRYLGLLETSHLLVRLPAYAVNKTKRLIKAPRLFLCDSGLACHLAGLHSVSQLRTGDLAGFLLENAVLQDLYAWRETLSPRPEVLYWRTTSGKEVDFVIEWEDKLFPIEVKQSLRARLSDTEGLTAFLDEYADMATHGILLYTGKTVERLTSRIWAIPLTLALNLHAGPVKTLVAKGET